MSLTVADVRGALDDVAFDSPAGSLEAANQSLVVRTTATVNTPEAFEALVIDLDLPDQDGFDLLETLHRKRPLQGTLVVIRASRSTCSTRYSRR